MIARSDWVTSGRSIEFGAPSVAERIFVRESGLATGPAILFLHGSASSSVTWAYVEPMLAGRFRLGYVDFMGFGASSKPKRRYVLVEQARVARAAIGALGFDRFHLVAHDSGVSIAQHLLCDPSLEGRVAGVTFLNGNLYALESLPAADAAATSGPSATRSGSKARIRAAFASFFSPRARPLAELEPHVDFFAPMWESAIETTAVPLNFVWGLIDPIAGRAMLEHTISRQERLPNVTTLPDVGHDPQREAPDRVAASIAAFVTATTAGTHSAVLRSG